MSSLQALASQLPPLPERLLIGLSGGADSVALLLLALQRCAQVTAVHVNHGLRGNASDGDEQFVRALCSKKQVPLLVYRAVPPEHPSEDWARQARYGFFRQAMADTCADALVLAHHRDDQAETLLLHLLRGAGLTGLCGMSADTTMDGLRILRPLLGFTRSQLQQALTEAGQPWREDLSNQDPRYLRNAIRTQLLPLMEQLSPGAAGHLADTALTLQADEAALQALTAAQLEAVSPGKRYYPLAALYGMPPALQARVLRQWWQQVCPNSFDEHTLSRSQTDALTGLITAKASQQCSLPGRWRIYRGWQYLHLLPPDYTVDPGNQPAVPLTPQGAALHGIQLRLLPSSGSPGNGRTVQELPRGLLQQCVLRTWRPGDLIRPFGSRGSQSMQDYFTNRHIDAPFRREIPLLCRGTEVLLCAGVGAGGIPAFDPQMDNVRLTWQGDMPWMTATNHPKGDR